MHDLPSSIMLDWDMHFISHFWQSSWKIVGTKLDFSSSYHPQTDSQAEVVNRSFEALLMCLVGKHLSLGIRK